MSPCSGSDVVRYSSGEKGGMGMSAASHARMPEAKPQNRL